MLRFIMIPEDGKNFLWCGECGVRLQMTNRRGIYCPKCGEYDRLSEAPTMILHCAECKNPLAVTEGFGSYCLNCGFPPSMQDTYLEKM